MPTTPDSLAATAAHAAVASATWTQVYAWVAIVNVLAVFATLLIVYLQLSALRRSFSLSIYGSTYKSLAQVNDIALVNSEVAKAMNWGTPNNVFVWRLISHFELVYNLRSSGYISDSDWDAEREFIRDSCSQSVFQETWGQGSGQFNQAFRTFLTEEIVAAKKST